MNQKKAKSLRKLAGFHPADNREYMTVPRKRDESGNIVRAQSVCKGARMVYQGMKKKEKANG
jgi:hypothetical protein